MSLKSVEVPLISLSNSMSLNPEIEIRKEEKVRRNPSTFEIYKMDLLIARKAKQLTLSFLVSI